MSRTIWYLLFALSVLAALFGSHFYFYLRLVRDTALTGAAKKTAFWTLIALPASVVAVMPLSRLLSQPVARFVNFIPFLWMGAMVYLTVLLMVGDLAKFFLWLVERLLVHPQPQIAAARKLLFSRAQATVVLALTLLVCVAGVLQAFRRPAVVRLEVKIDGLPRAFSGFKLVQIADLHLGAPLGRSYLEQVVETVNSLQPDAVAVTGDLVDGSPTRLLEVVRPIGRLRAREGVFFVTGNHEFYSGWSKWRGELQKLGLVLLENSCSTIDREGQKLCIAGIQDLGASRFDAAPDLSVALGECREGAPVVLLSHQARIIEEAAARNVALVLSGHNHGGQIWPWSYLVLLQQPFIGGLHRVGHSWLYITEGTGFWGPPLRIGTRSEITELVLLPSTSSE